MEVVKAAILGRRVLSEAEIQGGMWGIAHRAAGEDGNLKVFELQQTTVEGGGQLRRPVAPTELREDLDMAEFYDGVVEGEAAWAVISESVEEPVAAQASAEEQLKLRDSGRALTEVEARWSCEAYEISAEAEPVWGAMVAPDVIRHDVTVPAQEGLLALREERGELSPAQQVRSRRRIATYFKRTYQAQGNLRVSSRQSDPPPDSFFAACLRVQEPRDTAAVAARHKAEEEVYRMRMALEGSQYTVFPEGGRWPSESPWAAMQQVIVRGGFAFKSGMALTKMDARMERRMRVSRLSLRTRELPEVTETAVMTRSALAEIHSYPKPPHSVQLLLDTVIEVVKAAEPVPACAYAKEVQDLCEMGFEGSLSKDALIRCKGSVKAAVKYLMQLERRGVRYESAALTYSAVKGFKAGSISDEAMERIMEIDMADLSSKSAAAAGLLSWLRIVALRDPPSPEKTGMLVHTLMHAPSGVDGA